MKASQYILMFLVSMFLLTEIKAQEFPNLDLSNYQFPPGSNSEQDAIATNSTMNPWRISHGSPNTRTIPGTPLPGLQVSAGNNPNLAPCNIYSEGALYPANFIDGNKFNLKVTLGAFGGSDDKIDEVFISFVKGVPDQTDSGDYYTRSYCFPSFTKKQDIIYLQNFATGGFYTDFITFENCVIADDDYDYLWITVKDSDGPDAANSDDFARLTVVDLSLDCCEPIIVYNATERFIYPGSTSTSHNPLPEESHAKQSIIAAANAGDIIIETGEDVTFRAGEDITITPSPYFSFSVEAGGNFLAIIEDCDCQSPGVNICDRYIPPNEPPGQNDEGFEYIYIPNVFDPSGGNGTLHKYFSIQYGSQYIMPYNASKATFRIFDRWGGLVYEQILDDQCNGLEPGVLFWDGCYSGSPAATGTYTYTLELENCHTSKLFSGSVLLLEQGQCGSSAMLEDDQQQTLDVLLNNFSDTKPLTKPWKINSLRNEADVETIKIFPNPGFDDRTLEFSLQEDSDVTIFIQTLDGQIVENIQQNVFHPKGIHQIKFNLPRLPNGVYLVTLKTQKGVNTQRMIKF